MKSGGGVGGGGVEAMGPERVVCMIAGCVAVAISPFSPFNDFIIQTCKCTRVTLMKLNKLFFKLKIILFNQNQE